MNDSTAQAPKSSSQGMQLLVLSGVTILIIACAYGVYAKFIGDSVPVGKEIEVGQMTGFGRAGNVMRNRARNLPAPVDIATEPDGIKSIGARQMSVKSGDYFAQLPEGADVPDNTRLYTVRNLLDPDDNQVLQARVELVMNTNLATQLQITKEQITKLSAIPINRGSGLRLDKADRDEIKTLWKAINDAPAGAQKDAATQKFIAQLKIIGDRCIEPTKKMMQNRTEQIKAILTADQLQKYLAQRGR
jgi:hypothetical protein